MEETLINTEVFEKFESNVRSYCRSFPTVFVHSKGAVMTDENGKNYIDFFAGAGALNYGHNPQKINDAMIDYLKKDGIVHSMDMYTAPKRDFIETFQKNILIPKGLNYKIQFAGPTGTNAVESAIKLARKVKKRENIFAFMGAFHGMTLGSLALTTDRDSRNGAGTTLDNVTHIPAPYMFPDFDVIKYIETLLEDDHSGIEKPAAIILESVQADGGIYVFEADFLKSLREICDKNDVLLICDEIQVGCARTGTFFSFERANIVPDMVTLSKSIGGCGMPMALLLMKPEYDVWSPGEHTGTFRGNQLSLVAGKVALGMMKDESIEEEVCRKGEIVKDFIEKEILPLDSKIKYRGIGLIWGIDFSEFEKDLTKKVLSACFKNGLIIERVGRENNVMKVMPPLVIEDELLIEGLNILKKSINEVIN